MSMRYIFGPVGSSRLGRSLGIDLLGRKICSFDCLYCEVGPTAKHTLLRSPYVRAEAIREELLVWRDEHIDLPDYVTLGGSGEPCLNSELPEILALCRELFPSTPLAVLTNSTLLGDPQVRAELAGADAVLPSLDSLVPSEYERLNQPVPGFDLHTLAQGLLEFCREFPGKIFLEVLLAKGINDTEQNLGLLKDYVVGLRPERVDVVTMTRPGAHAGALPVDANTLERWREALTVDKGPAAASSHSGPEAPQFKGKPPSSEPLANIDETIYASLCRRPQTALQLASALGIEPVLVDRALATLLEHGHILRLDNGPGLPFYRGTSRT
ncbi:MAG: radical SAM protein [Desulfovibrio sp.]|nr:MAG: radical SAM protein [Desulfovibrio sp.]